MKRPEEIILRPMITEKSTLLKEEARSMTFEVSPSANKIEIRKAVEKLFGVKVEEVRVVKMPRKKKRWGRFEGYTSVKKKAYVRLKEGEKPIEFFEGV